MATAGISLAYKERGPILDRDFSCDCDLCAWHLILLHGVTGRWRLPKVDTQLFALLTRFLGLLPAGRRRRWDQGESPQLPADPFQRHQALLTSLGVPPSKQPVAGAPYNGVASAVQVGMYAEVP
jgi:hypothetical protein